jgi:hypothetical protein
MNSLTLKEKGFTEFTPLKTLTFSTFSTNKTGVLVIVDSTLAGKPISDILYIGKSKKPAKRIFGGYLAGYGGKATRKIHSMLINDGYMEKVSVSWMESDTPKMTQQELLEDFKKEHGDYPVWNSPRKVTKKAKVATPKAAAKKPVHKTLPKPTPKPAAVPTTPKPSTMPKPGPL